MTQKRRFIAAMIFLAGCSVPFLRADDSALELRRQGVRLDNQGKHDEALEKLRQSVSADANDYSSQLALGTVAAKAGKFDEATAALEKAVQLEPNSSSAHYQLAMLYEKAKELAKARSEWQAFLKLANDSRAREIAERHLSRLGAL